jgi:hypothetical protein
MLIHGLQDRASINLTAYAPPNVYCNDSAVMNVEVVNMLQPNAISGPDTVCANVIYHL